MARDQASKMIGAAIKRKEDPRFITGGGKYTADVQLMGMAYMMVLRSPHAHARIQRIDASRALQRPDVLKVLTGPEVIQHCKAQFLTIGEAGGTKPKSSWPMAAELATYVGEPVAAVLATSIDAATDAVEMIDVDYEPLPAVVDMEKAAEEGSPLVHEDLNTNVCIDASRTVGDPDRAFREADGVVSLRLEQPRLVPNPMEPRAVVASYEPGTGNLTLWLSTQAPHLERSSVSEILGFPENKLRIIAADVGGGFGCKMDTYPETIVAAILSTQLARPVKWVESRQEHFIATVQGHGELQYVEAGYKKDGTLLGMRLRYYNDMGAYCWGSAPNVVESFATSGAQGAYKVQNLAWTTYGLYTNKVPVGPYRGYGQHATAYFVERVMDLIARELKMDPVEVRLKNFISRDEFPYQTPTGGVYDSGDYEAVLSKALQLADYDALREEQSRLREQGTLMGIGMAITVDATGLGPSDGMSRRAGYESALVRVNPDGKVTVFTGSSPHGQGMETTFAQIAADQLDIPFDDIQIIYGDTAVTPRGAGTFASRSLVVGGSAIVKASEQVRGRATEIAAVLLNIDPQHVVLEGGMFFAEDIRDRHVTWADVSMEAYAPLSLPRELERGLEAIAYWEPPDYTFVCSANIAVVQIDEDTGVIKLTGYISVNDCGTVVNPMVVEGQVHGGLAQGIGAALLEEALWDDSGQLVTGSFMDYALPSAEELPMFTLGRLSTPSPHNPLGAKGMGESPIITATPTIVNAVVDALAHLGVSHIDIPITSEKVWRILREKGVAVTIQ